MGTDGFEVDQADSIINRVSEEIKLPKASQLVNPEIGKIALLSFADRRIVADLEDCGIDVRSHIVVQFFVLASKPSGLPDFVAHFPRVRGTNGVA